MSHKYAGHVNKGLAICLVIFKAKSDHSEYCRNAKITIDELLKIY